MAKFFVKGRNLKACDHWTVRVSHPGAVPDSFLLGAIGRGRKSPFRHDFFSLQHPRSQKNRWRRQGNGPAFRDPSATPPASSSGVRLVSGGSRRPRRSGSKEAEGQCDKEEAQYLGVGHLSDRGQPISSKELQKEPG